MNKKIILIVDDVQFNHRTANMVLQDTYELYNALSAEEAFNILEKVRPDLILFAFFTSYIPKILWVTWSAPLITPNSRSILKIRLYI